MIKSANMGKIMNNRAFDHKRIAEGYAKRPWLHKSVMEQLKKDCNLNSDFTFKNGIEMIRLIVFMWLKQKRQRYRTKNMI